MYVVIYAELMHKYYCLTFLFALGLRNILYILSIFASIGAKIEVIPKDNIHMLA